MAALEGSRVNAALADYMVAVAVDAVLVVLALALEARSASYGPARPVLSHQLALAIFN